MPAADAPAAVALLARPGPARERLRAALDAAGAQVVLEVDPCGIDAATLAAAAPQVALVALEPAVEDALVALEPALEAPGLLVIFDEAELAARREGWEAQRWIRHLAAKLHGHDDVLPPGREQDLVFDLQPGAPAAVTAAAHPVDDPFEAFLAEAGARTAAPPPEPPAPSVEAAGAPAPPVPPAAPVPPPLPDAFEWTLDNADTGAAVAAAGAASGNAAARPVAAESAPAAEPGVDFSRLELVALETETPSLAASAATGAVLVVAGIGGPDAVRKLLAALPQEFGRPLLVQLRLDGGRYDNLVKQLARVSQLPVAMAMPGDVVAPATVYVMPDRVGIAAAGGGLAFVDGAGDPIEALPPGESAVLVLSGAETARVELMLALLARGGHVAGQALEGCYDATAVKLLAAAGVDLGTPAELAAQLVARWP